MSIQATAVANRAITGRRVFLRELLEEDLEEFTRLNRRSIRLHRGLVSPPRDSDSFVEYLEKSRIPANVSLLICPTASGAIMGAINLSQIFRGGFQNAYLGYFIGAPFAKQGYMTEALQLMRPCVWRVKAAPA
jgi:[ribosomal protein S5]-alanine N-acetyltransferase